MMGPLMPVPKIPTRNKTIQFCKLLLPTYLLPPKTSPLPSFPVCLWHKLRGLKTTPDCGGFIETGANHSEFLWSWADVWKGAVRDILRDCLRDFWEWYGFINCLAKGDNFIILELMGKWHEKSCQIKTPGQSKKNGYKIITSLNW